MSERKPFLPRFFAREDESEDDLFYRDPRLVVHIDDGARAALTACYAHLLPPGGRLLDLMSSMESHLPADVDFATVTGLGMNALELAANPRLTERLIQDLNHAPKLPFADGTFDACLIAVSVQYLTHPVEVFAEMARVLAPGAPAIVSFSNRCFPTKAVAVWLGTTDAQHAWLVGEYFARAGGFEAAETLDLSPGGWGDPLWAVTARRAA
ncbi:MAG: class I SAM-dependent methyltransferase [Alphaproteobacteria bacterium]